MPAGSGASDNESRFRAAVATDARRWRRLRLRVLMAGQRAASLLARVQLQFQPPIPEDVDEAAALVRRHMNFSQDLILRKFTFKGGGKGVLAYLNGMVDQRTIDQDLLVPLRGSRPPDGDIFDSPVGELEDVSSLDGALQGILDGNAVVMAQGSRRMWKVDAKDFQTRGISGPQTEQNILGPKEAFIESLQVNITLVRHHLRTPALRVEMLTVGRRSHTKVALMYLADVADPRIVGTVRARLQAIDTDVTITSVVVRAFLRDKPWSPFPTLTTSERPDWCAFMVSNGRILVMVDGDPFALIAPTMLWDFFRTTDDYTHDFWSGSFIRAIRFVGSVLGLSTPGLYVSLLNVHPELIPADLALAMAGSREWVPFPAYFEMSIMLVVFEILREVSIRMPRAMGQTLGVVGGLVVGQSVVSAGIISPLMVVVIAITSLSVFILPKFEMTGTWRVLLWGGLVTGAVFGLFGLTLYFLGVVFHLASLRSIGVAYTGPVAPFGHEALLDVFIRAPFRYFRRRPLMVSPQDVKRAGPYRQPLDDFRVKSPRYRGGGRL